MKRKRISDKLFKGQATLEFAFCMIVVFLMIYGITMILRWTGMDLAERRRAHDTRLIAPVAQDYVNPSDGPLYQVDPYFYNPIKMNAIWRGDTGGF